jgi:hypothetical protein
MDNQRSRKLKILLFLSTLVLSSCVQDHPEKEFINDYNQLIEQAEWVPLTDLFEQVERRILIDEVYTYVSLSPSEKASFCDEIVGNTLNLSFQTLRMQPKETAVNKFIVGTKFKAFPNEQDSEKFRATIYQRYKIIDDPDNRVITDFHVLGFSEVFTSPNDVIDLLVDHHYSDDNNQPVQYLYKSVKDKQIYESSTLTIITTHLVNEISSHTIDEIYFKVVTKETFQLLVSKYEAYDEEWSNLS